MAVATDPLVRGVLRNDAITRGLEDVEARMLVEWLVDWTELFADVARTEGEAQRLVQRLIRRARSIARFVQLYCTPGGRGAAVQLAATERFGWPLPSDPNPEPADLMDYILAWESEHQQG